MIAEGMGPPRRSARLLSALALLVANVLPIIAVLRGSLGVGEVFVIYWLENVVIWASTIVKILTARRPQSTESFTVSGPGFQGRYANLAMAVFFSIHFGIFTFVHGVFSFVLVAMTGGFKGDGRAWLLLVLGMVVSHGLSLAVNWFGQRERDAVSPARAMTAPYPRMVVLHGSVIGAFFLMGGPDGSTTRQVGAVVLLCGLKLLLDLGFHLREGRRNREILLTSARAAE